MTTDQPIHDFLVELITLGVVAYLLILVVRWLLRSRPDLSIGTPIAVAFLTRIFAAAGVAQLSFAQTLRGGDELTFLGSAHQTIGTPFGSSLWIHQLTHHLFVFVFAGQLSLFDSPDLALRTTQAGIAVAGLALLAVAVYELAGARAALVAAWLLALEPTNVFFSTLLHKEPNMMLAGGLVAYGGARMWRRSELRSLVPIVLGCLIAVATRPYAGWFLIAAAAAITLHAGIRARRQMSARALVLVATVVLFAAITAPTVWQVSTPQSLQTLQGSQNANASNQDVNLSLEQVNFSTRGAIITNLPTRIRDVLLKPYPWQLDNASQQFGLLGTLVAYSLIGFLIWAFIRNRGRIMELAGPLIYLGFFLLIAYSLSAGNAGTAFRYRTHLVAVAICIGTALALARSRSTVDEKPELSTPAGEPLPAR